MSPLALYIHWPFCLAKCPYCDFNSHVRAQVDDQAWRAALLSELASMAERTPGRRITSIFFGGGTPSLMPPSTAGALIEAAARHWEMDSECEITLECNPTSAESTAFAGFKAAGVNRISLGVQALCDEDLAFLGRKHSVSEALAAVKMAARIFPRYSFDLIYARPGQFPATWKKELGEALHFAGDHLSLYQLTIEENTGFHAAHARGEFQLPDEGTSAALYEITQERMEAAGLPAYEVSNHARPGCESRHNLAYWRGQEYVGIGPGAHGRIRAGQWIATSTIKSPERWLNAVEKRGHGVEVWQCLSEEERREEALMMGLRLREGLSPEEFSYLDQKRVEKLRAQGLLENDVNHLRATPRGTLLLNAVIAELLA